MNDQWKDRPEAGTESALKLTIWLTLGLGRRITHWLCVPVSAYFLLVRGSERRASQEFLGRTLGRSATLGDVFRHFLTFAQVTVDRIYFLSGRDQKIEKSEHDIHLLQQLGASGSGGVFLAAHMGSFEAARTIAATNSGLEIRMVLDRAVNKRFIDTLESFNPGFAASLIDANQSESSLGLVIAEAIQQGSWVGFLADRYMPDDRTVNCEFMGSPAKFPLGPFLVAAVTHVPIVCVFPLYTEGRYDFHCEILAESITLDRKDREAGLQELAQRYAQRLEHYAKLAPYNWFNFYPFWTSTS